MESAATAAERWQSHGEASELSAASAKHCHEATWRIEPFERLEPLNHRAIIPLPRHSQHLASKSPPRRRR